MGSKRVVISFLCVIYVVGASYSLGRKDVLDERIAVVSSASRAVGSGNRSRQRRPPERRDPRVASRQPAWFTLFSGVEACGGGLV
jgi:hypothetical protein